MQFNLKLSKHEETLQTQDILIRCNEICCLSSFMIFDKAKIHVKWKPRYFLIICSAGIFPFRMTYMRIVV